MDILYPCSLCPKNFVLKKDFLTHMKTCNKSILTEQKGIDQCNDVSICNNNIDTKSLFACSLCFKPFNSKGLLKTHMYLKHSIPIHHFTPQLVNKSKVSQKLDDYLFLKDLLPDNYTYKILTFKDLLYGQFKAKFKITNMNKESFLDWLCCLCHKSKVNYVSQMLPTDSSKNIFRNVYNCKNINYWSKITNSILRNPTNCNSSLSVVIKYDNLDHQTNAIILIKHRHYHPMNYFTSLQLYQNINNVYNQLQLLFFDDFTVAGALYKYKMQIIQSQGKEHYLNLIKSGIKPDVEFVYDLYYKINGKSKFPSPFIKRVESLMKSVSHYNNCTGTESAAIKLMDNNIVLAIRTPLKEKTNTNMVFVCSTNFNICKTWFMFCRNDRKTIIPIGIIIATSDNECMLKSGLALWKELGGSLNTIMVEFIHTQSFQSVFPEATICVSRFHFLLGVWKWLFDGSTDNWNHDQLNCFVDLKKIVCSENTSNNCFDKNFAFNLIETYPHFNQFMQNIFKSNFVFGLPPITNPCSIFERKLIYYHTKSLSIVQMFHFVIDEMDLFFDPSTNSPNNQQITLNDLNETDEEDDNFTYYCLTDKCSMYLVESDDDKFFVDLDIGLCSCTINNESTCFNIPCNHQIFLYKQFNDTNDLLKTSNTNDLEEDISEKNEFENILSDFRYVNNKIREQFITDPDYFKTGIQSFVSGLNNNLNSEKSLFLACHSLNKIE